VSELEDIVDRIIERNETLFEIESASQNETASVMWTHDNVTVMVRFGVTDGHLYADVTGWREGEKTSLTVSEAMDTAIVYMGKEV